VRGVPSTSIEYTISVPCGDLVDSSQIVIAAAMTAPKHKKKHLPEKVLDI